MDNQENNQINAQTSTPTGADQGAKKTDKLMFLIVGAVLILVLILLAMIFSGALNKSNRPAVPTPQAQQIITPTPSDQGGPITNQQDVANALQQMDNANPDAVGADLDLNSADASSFSQ